MNTARVLHDFPDRDRWVAIEPEADPALTPVRARRGRTVAVATPVNPLAPVLPQPVLIPIIGENDEILPAIEERLHPIAMRAKHGDRTARNALYTAFEPKIRRIARRLTIPSATGDATGVWDRDDVYQEAFIAFAELVRGWPETIPFARYLLANIPWRLRDAVYRGIGRRNVPPRTNAVAVDQAWWIADHAAETAEVRALIVSMAETLPHPRGRILYEHIWHGKTLTAVAEELKLSRRTVTRHWAAVRQALAADRPDREPAG